MPVRRVPRIADRHLLSRFSYGVTPGLSTRARAQGGARRWFEDQLTPRNIADERARTLRSWYPHLDATPQALWRLHESGARQGFETGRDLQRWTLLRRIYSTHQVHEAMTEFWSNLLHVPAPAEKVWPHRSSYDTTIRRHALGRFDEMLVACDLHPAMGCFLDNALSTAKEINENLGREVLELHTVGLEARYTEDMVRDSAHILTGFRVDMRETWRPYYAPADHKTGPVHVLGFSDPNDNPDGRALARRYLTYLARHPATARRVAHRLCVRFVRDTPSESLVATVADAFVRSGTDVKTTLRALVDHPEFADSVGHKVRTPSEDAVATYRAMGVQVKRPVRADDFGSNVIWQVGSMGQQPFDWGRPDGFPDVADAWTGVSRMLGSWQVHWSQAAGYWPSSGVTYRTVAQWLPPLPAPFSYIVDDLSRHVLARPANPTLQQAVTAYTGIQPWERIRTASDISPWRMAQLLSLLLDTPAHMSR